MMSSAIELVNEQNRAEIISKLVLKGDVSGLSEIERVRYYTMFCESLGLNPATQPFQFLNLNGKQVMYAKKDATEQLRKINGVSVTSLNSKIEQGIIIVTATGADKTGRTDAATGAVNVAGLKGDAMANAIMKAETKAKRRLTLSICGLGILDETELETIPGAAVEVTRESLPEPEKREPPPKAPADTSPGETASERAENPLKVRHDAEVAIGSLAKMLSADTITSCREYLKELHEAEKNGSMDFDKVMEKVVAMKKELEDKVDAKLKETGETLF
jgi:hypothetical protein